MTTKWDEISFKLNEEVDRTYELFEALLIEEDKDNVEKSHWWEFLSTLSGISIEELKQQAKLIYEKDNNQNQKEIQYCELLQIEKPLDHHLVGPRIKEQGHHIELLRNVPYEYDTKGWIFRWIYTYSNEDKLQREPGIKLSTLKRELKNGRIIFNKLFKRASFTSSVRNGTPEKCSQKLIQIDLESILRNN